MKRLLFGAQNSCTYLWEEDVDGDRSRLIDWDLSEEEAEERIKAFDSGEMDECEYEMWEDGEGAIRETMNGFRVLSWRP